MIELITGHAGTNHIDSEDIRALYRGIFGNGSYILQGSEDEKINIAMSVRVPALELILDGNHMRIDGTDTLNFLSTTQGTTRIDYICATYMSDAGIESAELRVVKENDLSSTFDLVDYPLYKCVIDGSNMKSITCMLKKLKSIDLATQTLAIGDGGTGATTAADARKNLGLTSVFSVQTIVTGGFRIDPTKGLDSSVDIPVKSGYTPIGIVGYTFAKTSGMIIGTSVGNPEYLNLIKLYITGNQIKYRVQNVDKSNQAIAQLQIKVLYVKTL